MSRSPLARIDRRRMVGGPRAWLVVAGLQLAFFALMTRPRAWESYRHILFDNASILALGAVAAFGLVSLAAILATLSGARAPFFVISRVLERHPRVLAGLVWALPALNLLSAFLELLDHHFGSGSWPWIVRLRDAAPNFAAVPTVAIVTRVLVLGLLSLGAAARAESDEAVAKRRELAATRRTFRAGLMSDSASAYALLFSFVVGFSGLASAMAPLRDGDPSLLAFMAAAAAMLGTAFVVAIRRAARVDIGLDGVRVRHADTTGTRLVEYRGVRAVTQAGSSVTLSLRHGDTLTLSFYGEDAPLAPVVSGRIERAITASQAISVEAMRAAEEALEARVSDAHADHYRATTVPAEQLWSLVEGPGVTVRARVAAAEILLNHPETRDMPRLRLAIDLCLDPESHAALAEAVRRTS